MSCHCKWSLTFNQNHSILICPSPVFNNTVLTSCGQNMLLHVFSSNFSNCKVSRGFGGFLHYAVQQEAMSWCELSESRLWDCGDPAGSSWLNLNSSDITSVSLAWSSSPRQCENILWTHSGDGSNSVQVLILTLKQLQQRNLLDGKFAVLGAHYYNDSINLDYLGHTRKC